ncbi:MAG: hypothetical protein PVF68_11335 [Acidobacteriota bacterium]|jgi:hypothetical protein
MSSPLAWVEAVRQLHENHRLVAAARHPIGRFAVVMAAAVLMLPFGALLGIGRKPMREIAGTALREPSFPWAIAVVVVVALVSLAPDLRRWTLSAGAVVVFALMLLGRGRGSPEPLEIWNWSATREALAGVTLASQAGVLAACGAVFLVCWWTARNPGRLPRPVRRAPQVTLHAFFWLLVAIVWLAPGAAWRPWLVLFAATLSFTLWRLGYLLMSGKRGSAAGTGIQDHLFYMWPFWGQPSVLPYGKGYDYLSTHERADPEAFARAQLGGLKLLVLSRAWSLVEVVADRALLRSGDAGVIPRIHDLVTGAATASIPVAWTSLYAELVLYTVELAAAGHFFIGCLRLCGYGIYRNTYKPLLSRTILDFWNRFNFYFKELLVDFFFFPIYLRWFRGRPKLRIFAAVMGAACVGNLYFSLIQRPTLYGADMHGVWTSLNSRAFYCLLLGLGVCVSMIRQQARRGHVEAGTGLALRMRHARAIFLVCTYYGIIHIWNLWGDDPMTFAERTNFFLGLFGLPPLLGGA